MITSGGDAMVAAVPAEPAVVVATPGAEPVAAGGYGAALLLDGWALLGRQDLRAAEDTLRRWMAAAALVRSRGDGGVVAVVAESAIPTVQSLIRWDPVGHADAELDARAEVGLPPAVHIAAVDGAPDAVHALLDTARTARRPPSCSGPWTCRSAPADRRASPPTARSAGCWCGCPATADWRSRRRCDGPPACSARGTINSQFVCKSTRCT